MAESFASDVSGVIIDKLLGNHLIQATAAARPIWTRHPKTGVRNLLDASDDLTNYTSWTHANAGGSAVLSAFSDGTPATRMTATTQREAVQRNVSLEAGVTYTMSLRAVIDPGSDLPIARPLMQIQSVASNYPVIYHADLDGDGYGQFSFTAGATETVPLKIGIGVDTTEDGFTDILFGWPQLEKSAAATDYQTRVSKYDVTEAGVADCYGLTFDGVDDYMVTAANLDLSGTDKAVSCVGTFKTSDATPNICMATGSGNGTLTLRPVRTAASGIMRVTGVGTSTVHADTITNFAAPVGVVMTGSVDISAPETGIMVNGVVERTLASSLGTGSLSSQIASIGGSPSGTSNFAGTIYGVTLTDYILDADQLAALETWTAARTPEVTLA